jgi:hypothetical protein
MRFDDGLFESRVGTKVLMQNYTNVEEFLEQLALGVVKSTYTKGTFPKALDEQEWTRLVADLARMNTVIKPHLVPPFQFIGILPQQSKRMTFTYAELSTTLHHRLDLIKFAKQHIKEFTAVRH